MYVANLTLKIANQILSGAIKYVRKIEAIG